jgi:hypothetical protein
MSGGAPVIAGLGGVLLFLAAGRGLVELLPALRERPLAARLGWSYLLGVAAVAGSTYVLGIAFDIRIRRGVVLAPVAALVVVGLLARALRRATPGAPVLRPPRAGVLAARAAFGISALITVGLFAEALTRPNVGYDGEMAWCAAARWVRADQSVTPRVFTDPRTFVSHPRYPILMPLAQVAVQETFDLGDDRRAIKPLYAAFFPALLLILFDLARRHAGTCAAALAAVALAGVPVLAFTDFGGADGAFSDVPLGAFFGSGFLLILGRVRRSEAIAAALLLGAAVLTKNEGLPFVVAALAAAAVLAVIERPADRRKRLASLGFAAAVALFASLGLRAWQSHIPQRWDENYLGRLGEVSLATEARARLPLLPRALIGEMTNRELLAGLPLAGAVILAVGMGGLRRRIVPPIVLCLYFCFGAYLLALLLSPWGGIEQLHPTWCRFLTQLSVPVGVLLALALRAGWRARFAAVGTTTSPGITVAVPPGRVTRARGSPRGFLVFLGFAALPVVATWLWASHVRERARSPQPLPSASVAMPAPTGSPWWEDPSLTGSLDDPAEGATVRGELKVRGWARIPGKDLHVTVLIDGKERPFATSARPERRDLQRAVPSLGDCASAGYEFTYAFSPENAGVHKIQVLFRTHDGRERHYPAQWFIWNP